MATYSMNAQGWAGGERKYLPVSVPGKCKINEGQLVCILPSNTASATNGWVFPATSITDVVGVLADNNGLIGIATENIDTMDIANTAFKTTRILFEGEVKRSFIIKANPQYNNINSIQPGLYTSYANNESRLGCRVGSPRILITEDK